MRDLSLGTNGPIRRNMESYELRLDPSFICPLNDCIYNPEDAKSQRREEIGYLQSRDNHDLQ